MAGTDFSHLTNDELIKGIKALDLPDYIRSKAYGIDVRETLAQMTEMTIQLGFNMGLSPDDALKWARKLQETVSQSEFDSWIATLLDGGPSLFFETKAALVATYPNGAPGVALVRETDPAKIYVWNGSAWEDFGDYQGIEIKDEAVTTPKIADSAVNQNKTNFVKSKNFPDEYIQMQLLGGNTTVSTGTQEGSVTVRYQIEKNTSYRITKEPSNRFRVVLSKNATIDSTSYFVKDEILNTINEGAETEFVLNSGDNEYVYIYVSTSGQTPLVLLSKAIDGENLYDAEFEGNVTGRNIEKGKNLFDGRYITGAIYGSTNKPNDGLFKNLLIPHTRTAVIPVELNTDYSIYKTLTNRFRIALAKGYPYSNDYPIYILQDDQDDGDNKTQATINTMSYDHLLVTVSNNVSDIEIPTFMQVEKGSSTTALETYGFKFKDEAKPFGNSGASNSDVIHVEDYRMAPMTDKGVLQAAFDMANGQVVSFDSGREYLVDDTVIAKASKVRGILGNNAMLKVKGVDNTAFIYEGNKKSYGAGPSNPENPPLVESEMSPFLKDFRITSDDKYENTGLILRGLFSINLDKVFITGLDRGIVFNGYNRNLILSGLHVYDNKTVGIHFDNTNIHQINIVGIHGSYSKDVIKFTNSDIANIHLTGVNIENDKHTDSYGSPSSLIAFEGTGQYEVIVISGSDLQDHGSNTAPLIDTSKLTMGKVFDLIVGDTLIGNCGASTYPVHLKNVDRFSFNNTNLSANQGAKSFVLEGDISDGRIIGSYFNKLIDYSSANLDGLIVGLNATDGLYTEDTNEDSIRFFGNI